MPKEMCKPYRDLMLDEFINSNHYTAQDRRVDAGDRNRQWHRLDVLNKSQRDVWMRGHE